MISGKELAGNKKLPYVATFFSGYERADSMTKVEALKELYKAMGGAEDTEDKQTVAEMLNMISDIGEGEHSDDIAEAIKNIADVAGSITPTPATLKELTLENALSPGVYPEQYDPADEDADGYSLVTLKAPSEEEVEAEWIEVELTVNVSDKTVTIDSTDEELTAAFKTKQTDEPRFYFNIHTQM